MWTSCTAGHSTSASLRRSGLELPLYPSSPKLSCTLLHAVNPTGTTEGLITSWRIPFVDSHRAYIGGVLNPTKLKLIPVNPSTLNTLLLEFLIRLALSIMVKCPRDIRGLRPSLPTCMHVSMISRTRCSSKKMRA